MIKLINLLKELNESKQVGNLYHFTPLSNLKRILETRYLLPNDEKAISTSIRPNMETEAFSGMKTASIARLMLDGDKISTNYKIKPFSYEEEDLGEEQIIVNGNKFYFIPYLKRIDIFLNKKEQANPKTIELLEKATIPYKIYQGTPTSNIPYSQPKTGNPEDINIKNIPEKKIYTEEEMYFPGMKSTTLQYYEGPLYLENNLPVTRKVYISPQYPDYYIQKGSFSNEKHYKEYLDLKGNKLNVKLIPIPMYDDPKWRKMWKTNVDPPYNVFSKAYNAYVLIPKK